MKKVTIYLADLCHNQFGLARSSISLGIGTIGAYQIKKFAEKVKVRLFTTYDDLLDGFKEKEPDIVGLANFGWNENLNVKMMSVIARDFPNVLIVTGGANISPYGATDFSGRRKPMSLTEAFSKQQDAQILAKMPHINYFVHGDGELPMHHIVNEYIKHDCSKERMINEKVAAPGTSLVYQNQLIFAGPLQRLKGLDEFDSPYALGLYDEILDKYDLVPQTETDRGCPFECGFCTIGGWTNAVIKHSVEWIKKEILYLKERSKIKILRIANSNFGLLKHDIEIAKYIKNLRDKTGYPNGIRVHTAARGAKERVKNLMQQLGDMLPLNLSTQTFSGEVLANVTRANQSEDVIKEMSLFASKNKLMLSTEIIIGLPGETYESFVNTFNQLFKYGFQSIVYGPLILIRGSDLYSDEARKKYKFKTKCVLIEKSVSVIEDELFFEYDQCPTESSSYTESQYWDMHRVCTFAHMTSRGGYYKELYSHALNSDITFKDIFLEIKNNPSNYPLFSKSLDNCINAMQKHYFSNKNALKNKLAQEIKLNGTVDSVDICCDYQEATAKLLSYEYRKKYIDEFSKAIISLYASKIGTVDDEYCNIIENLKIYTELSIISPQELPEERLEHTSNYDLEEWLNNQCSLSLSTYKLKSAKKFILKVRNYSEHKMLNEVTKDWTSRDRDLFYFRQVVSSNHRRFV
jgi:radical SAM superfamily enzyme YgiQ (UPF0313 family)